MNEYQIASSEYAIHTSGLTKIFGRKHALRQLDLSLPRGGIHAIVGANGAGKSTLFRVLLGFLPATKGSAHILGKPCATLTPDDRQRIGFVNEEHTLPTWLSVERLTAAQRRLYPRWDEGLFQEVLGHFHVEPQQIIGALSRGERAGLNLALALAQKPEILILDEPTLGLDVVAKRMLLETLLQCHQDRACTTIYCSHQMEEVERVADNLVILERGELLHMSPPDEFCERVQHWVADLPPKPVATNATHTIPGLLEARLIDGLQHLWVLDQGAQFETFLREHGATQVQGCAVGLDRAVNAVLAKNHVMPRQLRQ